MSHFHNNRCVPLAGGRGSRLHSLTADRAKPGVAFGEKFRAQLAVVFASARLRRCGRRCVFTV